MKKTIIRDWDPREIGADCDNCPLKEQYPVKPPPPSHPKLIILGEFPDKYETIRKEFFVSRAGQLLEEIAKSTGIEYENTYRTNALLCRPPENLTPNDWTSAINACRGRLSRELSSVECSTILALGGKALKAIYSTDKITNWMGSPLTGLPFRKNKPWKASPRIQTLPEGCPDFRDYQFIATLHPAAVLRTPQMTPVLTQHFIRAWELGTDTLEPWEWGRIEIEYPGTIDAIKELHKAKSLAVDTETSGVHIFADNFKLLNIGVASENVGVSVQWDRCTESEREAILGLLATDVPKTMQNGQFDMLVFWRCGIELNGFDFDTMLAHQVIAPRWPHNLAFICAFEFAAPRWKDEFKTSDAKEGKGTEFEKTDPVERAIYNVQDCIMTERLRRILSERISKTHRGWEQYDMLFELDKIAQRMKWVGINTSNTAYENHVRVITAKKEEALEECLRLAANANIEDFNINARGHIAKYFKKIGCVSRKRSQKTFLPSYDKEALVRLASHANPQASEMAKHILIYRKWAKLLSTYVQSLPNVMDAKGYIHTTWRPGKAKTSRWASSDPNMQNQPKSMKDLYVVRDNSYWIADADYSQLELRITALLSGDEPLLQCYAEGRDVHDMNTEDLFKVKKEDNPDRFDGLRKLSKGFIYGLGYGASDDTIWKALVVNSPNLRVSDISRMRDAWNQAHPQLKAWQEEQQRQAKDNDYIEDIFSGKRYGFYGEFQPTIVANYPMQAGGAYIVNQAMLRVNKMLQKGEYLLAQVHDSIVIEGPSPYRLWNILKDGMDVEIEHNGNTMRFPVDIGIGKNMKNIQKIEDPKDIDSVLGLC